MTGQRLQDMIPSPSHKKSDVKEFTSWELADADSPKWPENVYIMVTGEHWGCPPCVREGPLFKAIKTVTPKVMVHISDRVASDWNHYNIPIKGVPCYIQKTGRTFSVLSGISEVR